MAVSNYLWHRLSNNLQWACLHLFHLRGVAKPGHKLGSILQCKRDLYQGLVVYLLLRSLTWRVGMRLIQVARSLLVAVLLPVLPILGQRWAVGVSAPDVSQSSVSSSSSSAVFQVGMLSHFLHQWRSITSNSFVLNMVWGHQLQLRCHPPLFHNFPHFDVKAAVANHPIIQNGWMSCLLREQLKHLLVMLVSMPACLLFLSILVTSSPYLTLSSLMIICIYLLLRCLLSNMCGSLFSMVICFLHCSTGYLFTYSY